MALTAAQVVALNAILETAMQTAKVARVTDTPEGVTYAYGTARALVVSPDRYERLGSGDDIRDAFLRVTLQSGFDVAWPVRELMAEQPQGLFAKHDW